MENKINETNDEGSDVLRSDAQLTGRTEGPFGSNDADVDVAVQDNKNRLELENSANGLDSVQIRGGQDGRNNRGIGSTDMDSQNGLLRFGDLDDSAMELTEEGERNAGIQ